MESVKNIYEELCANALTHEFLHHFTSIENFKKIVEGQKLLLNRIDRVADKSENEFLPDFWGNKLFVGCFTHSQEGKKRFWEEYAKNNGVRISFPNDLLILENIQVVSANGYCFEKREKTETTHKKYDADNDWGYFDISKLDMLYIDVAESERWKNHGNGLAKNFANGDSYDWEEETRIRVAMAPIGWESELDKESRQFEVVKPSFENIFIKLNHSLLKNMFISVPEGASEDFVVEVRNILNLCDHTRDCKIFKLSTNGNMREIRK